MSNVMKISLLPAAISLCGGLRKMDFAVDLLWKMRQRGIACNVHTYSCLMNVCIKNNDLDMALNVFQKLQAGTCILTNPSAQPAQYLASP